MVLDYLKGVNAQPNLPAKLPQFSNPSTEPEPPVDPHEMEYQDSSFMQFEDGTNMLYESSPQ